MLRPRLQIPRTQELLVQGPRSVRCVYCSVMRRCRHQQDWVLRQARCQRVVPCYRMQQRYPCKGTMSHARRRQHKDLRLGTLHNPCCSQAPMPQTWSARDVRLRRMRPQRNARVCQLRKAWRGEEVHCSRMHHQRKPSWSLQKTRGGADLQDRGLHQPASPTQRLQTARRQRVA